MSAIWTNSFSENIGDLEKRGRRFGETRLAKTLEIWRNVVGDLEKLFGEVRWRFHIGVRYGVA